MSQWVNLDPQSLSNVRLRNQPKLLDLSYYKSTLTITLRIVITLFSFIQFKFRGGVVTQNPNPSMHEVSSVI